MMSFSLGLEPRPHLAVGNVETVEYRMTQHRRALEPGLWSQTAWAGLLAAVSLICVNVSRLATEVTATSGETHSRSLTSQSNSELKQSQVRVLPFVLLFLGQYLNLRRPIRVTASRKRHLAHPFSPASPLILLICLGNFDPYCFCC